MSSLAEFYAALSQVDIRDIEPDELRELCANPVFRALCGYCGSSSRDPDLFDHDELGIDPEEDV